MRKLLRTAIDLHRAGQHADAAALYRQILDQQPDNAEALHWFGVMHHQAGNHSGAITLIRQAVELSPDNYLYHGNLGEAQAAMGDHPSAELSFRESLRLWPQYPEAWCSLGTTLTALKRFEEAAHALTRAIELRPESVVAINNLGVALREHGDLKQAITEFRRAIDLVPSFAPAHTNLGLALLAQDLTDEALGHCQQAAQLDPRSAEIRDNLGTVLRVLDRLDDAWAEHWEALRLDHNLASANAHVGVIFQRRGHLDDARVRIQKAVDLQPENAIYWQWLAELYDERDEPNESIPRWRRVVELRPRQVSAHLALGRALQAEGQLTEARTCFVAAMDLEPDRPAALVNLAGLDELVGALDAAEAGYRASIRQQPRFAIPHARLATLLRGKLPDDDLAALEARLDDPDLDDDPRGRLLFALAHVLDGRGDYDRAAECLTRANALTRAPSKQRAAYNPAPHQHFLNGLLRTFNQGLFTRLVGMGNESTRPVFVFGLPRSGTTLIEQVLASHSQIHGAGELRLARRSFDAIPMAVGCTGSPLDCVDQLDRDSIATLANLHLDQLAELDAGNCARIVDKMPDNFMYLGLLAVLFPNATFIHYRRDLRDIAVSCWMTDFSMIRWANDFGHIAARFHDYLHAMEHWRQCLPVSVHHVDYEETVSDLEGVAKRLVAACRCEWEPRCLEFHRTERPVRTASVTQVRQPVYNRSVARWKNYEKPLADLFAALPTANDHSRLDHS